MASGLSTLKEDHLAGGASRLAALLIAHICPICSLFAPGQPGAALRDLVLLQRGQATSRELSRIRPMVPSLIVDRICGTSDAAPLCRANRPKHRVERVLITMPDIR